MKCFYHPERDAVGMCPECGKAACTDCMKDVDGGILCKGCIAKRLQAVQEEQKAAIEDREAMAQKAKKRLGTGKIVFYIFFFFGVVITLIMVIAPTQSVAPAGPQPPPLPALIAGGLLASAFVGYSAWSFYWGVPAVWGAVRRMFQKIGCFLILNPLTWLILLSFFLLVLTFIGGYYCILGGGWSQYRKNLRLARGET